MADRRRTAFRVQRTFADFQLLVKGSRVADRDHKELKAWLVLPIFVPGNQTDLSRDMTSGREPPHGYAVWVDSQVSSHLRLRYVLETIPTIVNRDREFVLGCKTVVDCNADASYLGRDILAESPVIVWLSDDKACTKRNKLRGCLKSHMA